SMSRTFGTRTLLFVVALSLTGFGAWYALSPVRGSGAEVPKGRPGTENKARPGTEASTSDALAQRFSTQVRPFLERYCLTCHGSKRPKADLDLSRYSTAAAVAKNPRQWELVLERLQAQEMPPEKAPRRPGAEERAAVITWIRDLRDHEAQR